MASDQKTSTHILEMDAALRTLGFIFYNSMGNHWFSASDKSQTMAEGLSLIVSVLGKHERLRFTAASDEIKVNGEAYESKTAHTTSLVSHLSSFGGCNFTIEKGLTQEEFTKFMELICRSPDQVLRGGDFTEAINGAGFSYVSSRKVILKEVSEEEIVVAKSDMEFVEAEEKKRIESDVLGFLKEEGPKATERQAASLTAVIENTEQMADLVMQAASSKPGVSMTAADKSQVAKIVVECLDKAFEALVDDPFSKTQKGKKAIANALQRLEKELLSKMEAGPEKEEGQMVTTAVERMTERLKMDSIVQDYSRKLKALEDSETKILRFMKLQGLDRIQDSGLDQKLNDEGLDVSAWHNLLAQSSMGGSDDEAVRAVSQLASLLGRLEEDVTKLKGAPDPKTHEQVAGDLKKVSTEVGVLTEKTKGKIDTLAEAVFADMAAIEAVEKAASQQGSIKLSRKQIVSVMVEVVQELCQPLSVISCSSQMLKDKMLGELSDPQVEVLVLVLDSAERIRTLVRNLEKVSGLPTALSPDKDITGMLNRPVV